MYKVIKNHLPMVVVFITEVHLACPRILQSVTIMQNRLAAVFVMQESTVYKGLHRVGI